VSELARLSASQSVAPAAAPPSLAECLAWLEAAAQRHSGLAECLAGC